MRIIYPERLFPSAVFPQCVDNQYVSPQVFHKLASDATIDYTTPDIRWLRFADLQTELIRSLIYSSEIVINRAHMINNHLLFQFYLPGSEHYSGAFIELTRQGVILPMLYDFVPVDKQIQPEAFAGNFQIAPDGSRAVAHLIEECGSDITVLVLAQTKNQLTDLTRRISARFESRVDDAFQTSLDDELGSNMFSDVFAETFVDEDGAQLEYEAASELFRDALLMASHIPNHNRQQRRTPRVKVPWTSREELYRSFLVSQCKCGKGLAAKECACVANGRFDTITDRRRRHAVFGAKAIVDLVYATGVPDSLQRFVFTPKDLPTRKALQDSGPTDRMNVGVLDDVVKAANERALDFHAKMNEVFLLPELGDLTYDDVLAIRELAEWKPFIDVQNEILQRPLQAAFRFDEFQEAFQALQAAISSYYVQRVKDRGDVKASKYFSFVSGAITILGDIVRIGVFTLFREKLGAVWTVTIDRVIQRVVEYGRDTVAVGPAEIMFELMDPETRKVKKSLSWSVDWMTRQVAWQKTDLLDFLRQLKAREAEQIEPTHGLSNVGAR